MVNIKPEDFNNHLEKVGEAMGDKGYIYVEITGDQTKGPDKDTKITIQSPIKIQQDPKYFEFSKATKCTVKYVHALAVLEYKNDGIRYATEIHQEELPKYYPELNEAVKKSSKKQIKAFVEAFQHWRDVDLERSDVGEVSHEVQKCLDHYTNLLSDIQETE